MDLPQSADNPASGSHHVFRTRLVEHVLLSAREANPRCYRANHLVYGTLSQQKVKSWLAKGQGVAQQFPKSSPTHKLVIITVYLE